MESSSSSSSTSSTSTSSSDEDVIVLLYAKRLRKKRRFWVHPTISRREECGAFHTLIQELKLYHERFREYFRLTVGEFEDLLQKVAPLITKEYTRYRKPIDPEQRLAVCLRFLSTGDSYTAIASSFLLGVSTVAAIVCETCEAIWICLKDEQLPTPTEDTWRRTTKRFHERLSFPNCLGAMDGKHIVIQAPSHSGVFYSNYKGTFSIVLLALVDPDYRFLVIDVGNYSSNSDGDIFETSFLGKALQDGSLNFPPPTELPGAPELGKVNHVVAADGAFPLKPYLLRPFPGRNLSTDKKVFNCRLALAQRSAEKAFGNLAQCFRVFRKPLKVRTNVVDKVVKAAVVLYNFLRPLSNNGNQTTDEEHEFEHELLGLEHFKGRRATLQALAVRNMFKQYFNSAAGEVTWQFDLTEA